MPRVPASARKLRPFDQVVAIGNGLVDPRKPEFRDSLHVGPDNISSESGRIVHPLQTARELGLKSGKFPFEAGDILYSKIRPNLNKVAIADVDGICSADMYVLKPKGIDRSFLFHSLRGELFYKQAVAASMRSGLPKVNRDDLSMMELKVPPPPEQHRIAAILDEWDNAIATAEKLVAAKQKRKDRLTKSIYFDAPNWFDASIFNLAEVVGGGTPSTNKSAYWDGDIPWCTPTDITGLDTRYIETTARNITASGLAASNATLLPVGSIILCSRASVGECAINLVPMATNQGFQSLVPKDQSDRHFLYYLVQAYKPELVRLSAGSTFLEFPKSALRSMHIRIPEAQRRQDIGRMLAEMDDEIDQTVALLGRIRLQKRGLMQRLLSGDLPVPASIDRLLPGGQEMGEAVQAEVHHTEATG